MTRLFLFSLLLVGCTPSWLELDRTQVSATATLHGLDHRSTYGVLELVNDGTIDAERLDTDGGLELSPAEAIVAHRRGDDGQDGGWDDNFFDDLDELMSLRVLDAATLDRLVAAAWAWGYVPVVELEGVPLNQIQHDRLLLVANHGAFDLLDVFCALDVRAVGAIEERRPYLSVFDLGDTPWVGPASIGRLLECASDLVESPELLEG